jgi:predicted patatin/cPLA2 family phospholipase
MKILETTLRLDNFDTLVFAGGGNRCWWSAGIITHLLDHGWKLPPLLIGTSAGAGIATALITSSARDAIASCKRLYEQNEQLVDWRLLTRLKLKFAHQHIYPTWLESFTSDHHIDRLRSASSELMVAITRPSKFLGLSGSLVAGSIAYMADKKIANSIHPRFPRYLGLRQEFLNLKSAVNGQAARVLLQAAAAAAPFMLAQRINGGWGFDGGYADNAPIPPQTEEQKAKTLVLLTRHYPGLPAIFQWNRRTYWQPSQKVPVSTWDCRPGTTVDDAFDLGLRDCAGVA